MNNEETPIATIPFSEARNALVTKFETEYVILRLKERGGNVTAAAKASRMTRQNFQRLMKKHEITAARYRKSNAQQEVSKGDTL